MGVLSDLKPEIVFKYFEELCSVPHGSGHMEPIGDYCVAFAKEHNLEHYRDNLSNVIMIKEASKGYENSPAVIIQGHLDMVCEKTADREIDFLKDGLELGIDGDDIYAKGTTLGGDNGIAIAMALAILASDDIDHPRIEAVFTVDEETGLYGAEAIDVSMLKAKKFINLDSEEEGVITVSCAGGVTAECILPVVREHLEGEQVKIIITGLIGGHSGIEIDKERANSNMLMGRLLYALNKEINFNIIEVAGGQKDNAIPKETVLNIVVADKDLDKAETLVNEYAAIISNEFKTSDPGITIKFERHGNVKTEVLNEEFTKKVIVMLLNIPNGIQSMSADIKGLVETSLNMGALKVLADGVHAIFAVRSSVETAKAALCDKLVSLMEYLGGKVEFTGAYPGWEYMKDSDLRETVIRVYEKQYGKTPIIEAIHAGLECGMFSEKIKDLDCVSLGPDMRGVHTVDERLSISSVARTWNLLLEVLKESK